MRYGLGPEVLHDVSFRVLPLGRFTAPLMLEEIRAKAILDGVRGQSPCDKPAIIELLMQISYLLEGESGRIKKDNYYIKPMGFDIPEGISKLTGISTQHLLINGSNVICTWVASLHCD